MEQAPDCCEKNVLVGYLYDDCEPSERERVEAHLATCRRCAEELESLRSVRGALEAWAPPEPSLGFQIVSDRDPVGGAWWSRLRQPAWGLAAAAVVLVVGAALVSVEMRVGPEDGFVFRMGWTDSAGAAETRSPTVVDTAEPVRVVEDGGRSTSDAPWRADLISLENELRRELTRRPGARSGASGTAVVTDPDFLEQIQTLISQSERRQQRELALWMTELSQELDMQRRADRQQVQQELGALEGFADYLVRVSQR